MAALRETAAQETKAERARAVQALRYARVRSEGLVHWRFDTRAVENKDLIGWAQRRMPAYFAKVD